MNRSTIKIDETLKLQLHCTEHTVIYVLYCTKYERSSDNNVEKYLICSTSEFVNLNGILLYVIIMCTCRVPQFMFKSMIQTDRQTDEPG